MIKVSVERGRGCDLPVAFGQREMWNDERT